MEPDSTARRETERAHVDASVFWAAGDYAPHEGVRITPLIDGRAAMLAMCRAFLTASSFILLAGWDICADLDMVRGEDVRMGPDGSPEQAAFIASLRTEGFSDEALALWEGGRLQVRDVLGLAVRRGVRVGVLLWDPPSLGVHLTNDTRKQREELVAVGVDCLLDTSSRKLNHLLEALHQKCAVVDGRVAFAGGVDLTLQTNGDYDRWDTHAHPPETPERGSARSVSTHPWHDAHVRIEGPAVADVQRNIAQRWSAMVSRRGGPPWPLTLPAADSAPQPRGVAVQIVRTIPPNTYTFAPKGIHSIYETYLRAVRAARRYIYLESQYFWPEVYRGLDTLFWGKRSREMTTFLAALGEALKRGVTVTLLLPDHPNCGRRYTDAGISSLRGLAPEAVAAGRLRALTLGTSLPDERAPGGMLYRPVYVHAKVGIVDDLWLTIGSANLNNRGFINDAELNIAAVDTRVATDLRLSLWAEHTQADQRLLSRLRDVDEGLDTLGRQASENFRRVGRREALHGHLLPYFTYSEARASGIQTHPEHGWLDTIEGGFGAAPDQYRNRYL